MTQKPTYILGINAYDHDVSACLLRDGKIAYAIEKERITRRKHATGFFQEVVDYVLDAEGITLRDVDLVVRNCYVLPIEDLELRLIYEDVPEFMDAEEREQARKSPLYLTTAPNVLTLSHHLGHAYSAFAACPFEEGAVMIVDGVGSYATDIKEPGQHTDGVNPLARESESYYTFKGSDLTCIRKVWLEPVRGFLSDEFYFMPGLGAMYSRVSSYIFSDWNKCGEVMGLAPYGTPEAFRPLIEIGPNGDLSFPEWDRSFNKPFDASSDQKWEASPNMQHWRDMAWRIQDDSEKVLIERAKWLRETTGAKNLVIAGGVGLNCVANGRIVREAGFENVWVQPAAGDNGIAIGCAYYGHIAVQKKPREFVIDNAYFGMEYKTAEVKEALAPVEVKLETKAVESSDICADVARLLAQGNIFGWFQGRSEYGPRSLGNRSILADPRSPDMKDTINKRVKHRQSFRPFAPVVLAERSAEIFEGEEESPFMLLAKNVNPEWKDRIPAIVHVDGTARVQTVRENQNPRLYRLLKEFEKLTGVPVLLNTSFNVRGEPIVEAPEDAVACFLSTGLDYLALHDMLISKTKMHGVLTPAKRTYAEIATMVRRGLAVD
ncbi:MAG: carbamoyltransferase [Hyphomicrobiaceae bacterium]|nr:carbamoyltransferase [Hyphomicrobiaceae bacterium]